jgi:hypothetical protein
MVTAHSLGVSIGFPKLRPQWTHRSVGGGVLRVGETILSPMNPLHPGQRIVPT